MSGGGGRGPGRGSIVRSDGARREEHDSESIRPPLSWRTFVASSPTDRFNRPAPSRAERAGSCAARRTRASTRARSGPMRRAAPPTAYPGRHQPVPETYRKPIPSQLPELPVMHGGTTSGVMAEARCQPGIPSEQLKSGGRLPSGSPTGRESQPAPVARRAATRAVTDRAELDRLGLPPAKPFTSHTPHDGSPRSSPARSGAASDQAAFARERRIAPGRERHEASTSTRPAAAFT